MINMKTNPNDPINPTTLRQVGEDDYKVASEKDIRQGMYLSHKAGITIRQHFAAMAMQGLLSNELHNNPHSLSEQAVEYADALIEALNTEKP